MRVAILTSKNSWFVPYGKGLVKRLEEANFKSELFFDACKVSDNFSIVFILSYFELLDEQFMKRHRHNLVVHESDLPKGKGWSPLFWQILEGKNKIPIVLFEASDKVDSGKILIKDYIILDGTELHDEVREKQANKTVDLCCSFLKKERSLIAVKQKGKSDFYKKRTSKDSELNINKTLKAQFNLLRICNNGDFPAFFKYKGETYILKIFREKERNKNK